MHKCSELCRSSLPNHECLRPSLFCAFQRPSPFSDQAHTMALSYHGSPLFFEPSKRDLSANFPVEEGGCKGLNQGFSSVACRQSSSSSGVERPSDANAVSCQSPVRASMPANFGREVGHACRVASDEAFGIAPSLLPRALWHKLRGARVSSVPSEVPSLAAALAKRKVSTPNPKLHT